MIESSVTCAAGAAPGAGMTSDTSTPTDVQTQPRRKRFAPRTRTGCLTCRVRRIKCDEARPACQRCIRAWRPCGGYHLPPPLTSADAQLQPTPVAPASAAELALSRYYIAEIGAVAVDEFNSCFWCRDVPQLGRAAPAVWHATNALAGAAWARDPSAALGLGAVAVVERESTRQYSAAVRHILRLTMTSWAAEGEPPQRPSPRDQTAVLLATLLLASYAVSVGERAVFTSIVAASRRLVRQWTFWDCLDVPSVAATAAQILYVYVKAERVAEEFHLEASPAQAATRPPGRWLDSLVALQRRPLTSTLRACLELDMMWNSAHDVLDALPPMPSTADAAAAHAARQPFVPLFSAWEARYDAYVMRLRGGRRRAEVDVAALDLRRALVSILLRVPVGGRGETCWDLFARDFAAAVAGLEAALPAAAASAAATGGVFSTPSIYASCNFVALKCRAPGLRRRAAAVMRSPLVATLGRRTSAGAEEMAAAPPLIVDRVMLVEESAWEAPAKGGCEPGDGCVPGRFICSLHRVARLHIDRTVAGPPEITFLTVGDILTGRPGHREVMDISLSSCAMGE